MTSYDSKADTLEHIIWVNVLLVRVAVQLLHRGMVHDQSKLEEPEKACLDRETPKLKALQYGSQEYKDSLLALRPALEHHYKHNRHHPEHWVHGINDMTLIDLIEMYCDWKAASERTKGGSLEQSIRVNTDRFGLSHQLVQVFLNTIGVL